MARPTRATYVRRRAVAAMALLAVVAGALMVLLGGGSDDGPARRASGVSASGTGRPARPRPRTDVAAVAARAHVPVLCYHQIRPLTAADAPADRVYIVPPKTLDAQLAALERAGFTSVSADAVAAHLADGAPLPRKPVLITFDDASAGQYTRALPLLRRHHFTATFFVMTVVLGKPGWLTKGQVRALDRGGMEIAPHTWDHHAVPTYTDADWPVQLTRPKAELEAIVGHRVDVFAYPFGEWNAAAFSHLRAAGIRIAFQLAAKLDPAAPMLTVRRVLVGPDVGGRALLRMIREDF
jgi:peptidoglycan/xylan/chitin deacetylase (PgdA/CDA1 family)